MMARLLVAALAGGGHDVVLPSTFRSYLGVPDPAAMAEIEAAGSRERERIVAAWRSAAGHPPDLWFTYHPYYKAPDLLGPGIAERLDIPYATAEASQAGKRASGPWARWHAANEAAIRAGALHVCFTPRDAEGLASLVEPRRTIMLPPFIAAPAAAAVEPRRSDRVELVAVAMMRAGDKARSFAFLAEVLAWLPAGLPWRLTIVGDGPERTAVEQLFHAVPGDRLAWAGEREASGVAAILAASDLYVWPGFGEAYGIAYLEAQAAGLPVLAMDCGGIGSVVNDGETGVLTPEGDRGAFVGALARLVGDRALRERLGRAGRRMVLEERTVTGAGQVLARAFESMERRV